MMERTLEFVVHMDKSETYVDVVESESGEQARSPFEYSEDKHSEFDMKIGAELYWWFREWAKEAGLDNEF